MVKKVSLQEWAEDRYTKPPSLTSLRCAAQNGLFNPPAKIEFGQWRVFPNAELVERNIKIRKDDPPELVRIFQDGQTKKT